MSQHYCVALQKNPFFTEQMLPRPWFWECRVIPVSAGCIPKDAEAWPLKGFAYVEHSWWKMGKGRKKRGRGADLISFETVSYTVSTHEMKVSFVML